MATAAANLDFAPRRGKARLRAGIAAELVTVGGRQKISLVDLSESGARLRTRDSAPLGRGVLKWMDFEAFGSVVRRDGNEIGLQFEDPIALAWVLDTKAWLTLRPRAKDELREFARDWVRGSPERAEHGRLFGTRGLAKAGDPHAIAPSQAPARRRHRTAMAWFRAAMPFALGGAALGTIAGLWSLYY